MPNADSVMLATADVQAELTFKRKHWTGQVWFDRATGAGLQRVKLKPGDDASRKSYRFGQEGVYRVVARPRDAGEATPSTGESNNPKNPYFRHPTPRSGCDVISDPLLLLIEASGLISKGNEYKRVCVFNKKTLYHVDLKAVDTEELRTSYDLRVRDAQSSSEGPVSATRVRITAKRVDLEAPRHEDFEFLGLEGDIAIWVDGATGLPLAIEGELPGVGQVRFTLTAASLL